METESPERKPGQRKPKSTTGIGARTQVPAKTSFPSLKSKSRSMAQEIKTKQRKAAAIDREIDRLIREAIAASNRAAGKKSQSTFTPYPRGKVVGQELCCQQGKASLACRKRCRDSAVWHSNPTLWSKPTMIKSNGVTIATSPQAEARAVFEGEVMSILSFKGSNPTVLIKHGNFITTYKNMGKGVRQKRRKSSGEAAHWRNILAPPDGQNDLAVQRV